MIRTWLTAVAQVQSLVRELRSQKPRGQKKEKQKLQKNKVAPKDIIIWKAIATIYLASRFGRKSVSLLTYLILFNTHYSSAQYLILEMRN